MSETEELLIAVKELFAQKKPSLPHKRSFVGFIPDILKLLFAGDMSREEFSFYYVASLNKRKFLLSIMHEEDMEERKRAEHREFVFAGALNKVALKCAEFDDEAFMQEILSCMRNYINSPEV